MLIRLPDQVLVHSEFSEGDHYEEAIWKAQKIVDDLCERNRPLPAPDRETSVDPLTSTLKLHEQIVVGLTERELAVARRETEARQILEQTLTLCADERANLGRERALLTEVEELYRRHAWRGSDAIAPIASAQPAPEHRPAPAPIVSSPMPEPAAPPRLVASEKEDQVSVTIRNLRQGLISEIRAEKEKA